MRSAYAYIPSPELLLWCNRRENIFIIFVEDILFRWELQAFWKI